MTLDSAVCQPVLAIDASCDGCSVALAHSANRFERRSHEPRSHAQHLLPMVDDVLNQAQINLSELAYIALVNGPGSFTGIRIALSIAQGLAFGVNIPVFCMSSLAVMAQQVCADYSDNNYIVSALDARMGEIYWAVSQPCSGSNDKQLASETKQIIAPSVSSVSDFIEELVVLSKNTESQVNFLGVGNAFALEALADAKSEFDTCAQSLHRDRVNALFDRADAFIEPNASALLALALECKPEGRQLLSAEQIEPLYLRNEVAWKKRQRIRQH